MDLPSLIGKPLRLPSGAVVGVITGAHTDKTGLCIRGTVTDPKTRKLLKLPTHESATRPQP